MGDNARKAKASKPRKRVVNTSAQSLTSPVKRAGIISPAIPEDLVDVWDEEIAENFRRIRPKQQDFLIAFLKSGNAADAYRKTYNNLSTDAHLCASAGSRMLTSDGIAQILAKFADQKTWATFAVIKGYREMSEATKADWVKDDNGQYENAGDLPDWQARKEALLGLRKVYGIDAAEKVENKIISEVIIVQLPNKNG